MIALNRDSTAQLLPMAMKAIIMASAAHDIEPPTVMRDDDGIDDKDGAGAIDIALMDATSTQRGDGYEPANPADESGWWWQWISSTRSLDDPVLRYIEADAGDRIRVALCWYSSPDPVSYNTDPLSTTLNLYVNGPGGEVDRSTSTNNNYEIVDFYAPQSGTYEIEVRQTITSTDDNYVGIAWLKVPPFLHKMEWSDVFPWTSYNRNPRTAGDVNGDGLADLVGFADDGVYVALASPTGFGTPTRWVASFGYSAGYWTSQNSYPRTVADVDADGRADVVGFGSSYTIVSLSTGSSFGTPTRWIGDFTVNAGGWTSQDLYPRMLADVNADGRADVVGFGNANTYVGLSNGSSFAAPAIWHAGFDVQGGWTSQNTYPRTAADINGDGRADLVGFKDTAVRIALAKSDGTDGFGAAATWSTEFDTSSGWTSQNTYPRMVADVSGDGKADVVGCKVDETWVSLAQDNGFASPIVGLGHFGTSIAAGEWTSQEASPRVLADVSGGDKADIVGFRTHTNGVPDAIYISPSRYIHDLTP